MSFWVYHGMVNQGTLLETQVLFLILVTFHLSLFLLPLDTILETMTLLLSVFKKLNMFKYKQQFVQVHHHLMRGCLFQPVGHRYQD